MNTDTPRQRCRWFVRRLPLLAGGDLVGTERRKVERHLITCPDCRRRQAAMAGALGVLRTAAVETTAGSSPSLWPALERQIREQRHAPRPAAPWWTPETWADALAAWLPARPRFAAALMLAAVVTAAVAGGVEFWAQRRVAALLEAARQPIAVPDTARPALPATPDLSPGSSITWGTSLTSSPSTDSPRPARLDYDLDTGTPMNPDARDHGPKASY